MLILIIIDLIVKETITNIILTIKSEFDVEK